MISDNGNLINECFQLKECFDIVPFSKAMVYKLLRKDNSCNEYLGYRIYYKEDSRIPIILKPENANLADLMQNNPTLTKEELLYWCSEFKEDLPGKEGTQFKIKLSKDQFSGNMTSEQIEDIARDLGFYNSGNIKQL